MKLEHATEVLKMMKKEHESYEVLRMLGCDDSRSSLLDMVNIDIPKPLKGQGYGILLPNEKEDSESTVIYTSARSSP